MVKNINQLQDLVKIPTVPIPTVATGDGRLSWEELVVLMMEWMRVAVYRSEGVDSTAPTSLPCIIQRVR